MLMLMCFFGSLIGGVEVQEVRVPFFLILSYNKETPN